MYEIPAWGVFVCDIIIGLSDYFLTTEVTNAPIISISFFALIENMLVCITRVHLHHQTR
jgi:hypothetical protein